MFDRRNEKAVEGMNTPQYIYPSGSVYDDDDDDDDYMTSTGSWRWRAEEFIHKVTLIRHITWS